MDFTALETTILNRVQKDFPVVPDPLCALAEELSIPENDFFITTRDLKDRGIIRNISGIFNADRLGFVSTLIAFCVKESDLEQAASAINGHPGVSHNYLRDHRYNVWFTLSAESDIKLELTVKILAEQSRAVDYIILRNEKLLKIGLMLAVGNEKEQDIPLSQAAASGSSKEKFSPSVDQKEAIRLLQKDLPLEKNPFSILIENSKSGLELAAFIDCFKSLKNEGVIRRYAAVLRHREAGYKSNAMTAWKPRADADMSATVKIFLDSRMISHLYMRTLYPGKWEYPLFAMIHARTDDELSNIIKELSMKSGIDDYQVLLSLKEFKKERVVYYSPRFIEWDRQAGI